MKTAQFVNFTNEDFTGYWDGKPKTFKPGESVFMPDYLAKHFAKHLTNRELLRAGHETSVSPKKPDQVPEFMEIFNKAYLPEDIEELGTEKDDIDALIVAANKNRQKKLAEQEKTDEEQDPNEPQIVLPPEDDDDDFEGQPIEDKKPASKPKKAKNKK